MSASNLMLIKDIFNDMPVNFGTKVLILLSNYRTGRHYFDIHTPSTIGMEPNNSRVVFWDRKFPERYWGSSDTTYLQETVINKGHNSYDHGTDFQNLFTCADRFRV